MKMKMKTKLKGESSGQSLVELAISLVMMIMLLLGAIEISIALFQYVTIRDAAQEAAVYASFNPSNTDTIKFHAVQAANDVLVLDANTNVSVTTTPANTTCEGTTGANPNSITVTIVYPHVIAFPFVGPMIGTNTINLRAQVTNAILWPHCP
jgi:Flp pilus assembly protein TadG